ncbi:MAG: M48 family metalloprotease, partial [Bacteroidales bacterium]|nr:M48 family metalloprotease [Bacteroidales bacterium]
AEKASFHMGILAFGLLYGPISLALGLIMNIISRKNEFAADRYAGENYSPVPLQDALKKLSVNHLSNLRPHPAYVFFYYSHPPLLARLNALERVV